MNVEDIRNYCLSLKGAEECFPFDDETLVFKALGKMFAFIPLEESELFINLKCDPVKALNLREKYQAVQPGYHMNKKYWLSVLLDSPAVLPQAQVLLRESYALVAGPGRRSGRKR